MKRRTIRFSFLLPTVFICLQMHAGTGFAQTKPQPVKKEAGDVSAAEKLPKTGSAKQPELEYSINSVELTGKAGDERAELTAILTVQVLREKEWLRIPLFLNEAIIRKTKHEFLGIRAGGGKKTQGTGAAAYSDSTRQGGYRWWFRGQGFHRLTLQIVAPVVKTVAQRQLRLTLVPLSATSTLTLQVPSAGLESSHVSIPKGPDQRVREPVLQVREIDKKHSEIQITGIGSQLDVKWQSFSNTRTMRPLLQAATSFLVNFTDDNTVVLTVLQRIQALSGKVKEIRVTLPPGFEAQDPTGEFVESSTLGQDNVAVVQFKGSRSDWTEIKWTLERKLKGRRLTLEGFQVERARVQSGDVAIVHIQGQHIEKPEEGNLAVHRIRASEFYAQALIRNVKLAGVYRFLKQPFRLHLDVSQLRPHTTIAPKYAIAFSKDRVTLDAAFEVDVSDEGGPIERVELNWPGWRTAGWTIAPLAASKVIERRTINRRGKQTTFLYRLFGRRGGKISIPLRATRTLPASGNAHLELPELTGSVVHTGTLVVTRTPNIEVEILTAAGVAPQLVAGQMQTEFTRSYRADAQSGPYSIRTTTHPRHVHSETLVTATPKPAAIDIRADISYDVRYEPLESLVFSVPKSLADSIQFFDENGQPLEMQAAALNGGTAQLVELPGLPTAGKHRITATYSIARESVLRPGDSAAVSIPLVHLAGTQTSRTRVNASAHLDVGFTVTGNAWRKMISLDGAAGWSIDSSPANVAAKLSVPSIPQSQRAVISRALIRALVGQDGQVRYRAQFRVTNSTGDLVVFLPHDVQLQSISVGRKPVESRAAIGGTGNFTAHRIPIAAGSESRLLTIDYRSRAAQPVRWIGRQHLVAPRFPETISVNESVWKISLPENQHLSSFGAGFHAEFRWKPQTFAWTRQPTAAFQRAESWIGSRDGPTWNAPTTGNVYFVRRFGPSTDLEAGSMSRSILFLIGAGISWLIGILLVKVPATRSVFTLTTAVLCVTVFGLWYSTVLQLLVQPVVVGVALTALFVGIERLLKKRTAILPPVAARPAEFLLNSQSGLSKSHSAVVSPASSVGLRDMAASEAASVSSEMRRPV